jgi:uncharacterized protein
MAALCAVTPARADLSQGLAAFEAGQFSAARSALAAAAEAGNSEAQVRMGEMLMRGWGGSRDELKARDYITRAHAAGNLRALHQMALMLLTGNLVPRDEAKGVDLMQQAAEKGEPSAQTLLGSWIANGTQGYSKDEAVALGWFKAAAAQNHAAALLWLGEFTELGRAGLAADPVQALDLYKRAAARNHPAGMTSVGRVYALGRGVSADGNEALRWLRRAAAFNHAPAFPWLGSVYEFGRGGVQKNTSLAYAWYAVVPANATASTLKAGTDGKERTAKLLSAADLAEAEKLSRGLLAANLLAVQADRSAGPGIPPRTGVFGSGVVVSKAGDVVTNEHVINGCERIRLQPGGAVAQLVAKDARNDLALLRVAGLAAPAAALRPGRSLRLGDEIVAIGYPLKGVLSSGAVVTTGVVNALSGLNDDTSAFQISATVQPGSSGGPVFDRAGHVVGIVRARLLSTVQGNPQNVNFAINLATVGGFLDAHSVAYRTGESPTAPSSLADMVEQARKSAVQVECF